MKIGVYNLTREDYLHPDVDVVEMECYEDLFMSACDELYINAEALDEAEYLFLHDFKMLYTTPKIYFV